MTEHHEIKRTGDEIAIIGMAGRFPGARNIDEFWNNLINGIECTTFVSNEELKKSGIDPGLIKNPHYVNALGGFLEDSDCFDASFFDYSTPEAAVMDPQTRIFHECAWEAIENAGYDLSAYEGVIGVYAGASPSSRWEGLMYFSDKSETIGGFAAMQLANKDFLCTRIAYKLDLKGPAANIQTACSTSLVAVHMSCQAILDGDCDMALAGGVSVSVEPPAGYLYQEGMILSPDGHCRAFAAQAMGTISGNGTGAVVLKSFENALDHGDYIYATIRGTAINNDGIDKGGYTAPSIKGQAAVIHAALQLAEVEPESISYVETHGTGTTLGDPIEIEALKQAYNTHKKQYCAIGSVKTNIGHLDAAAGITGLIKTALALKHKLIPPSLHYEKSNPKVDFQDSPFYVNAILKAWKNEKAPRLAGVSSFGIGGTNAHVILEEAPSMKSVEKNKNLQLILLSARTDSALERRTANLAEFLIKNREINLDDVAYTLQVGRSDFEYKRMTICTGIDNAVESLTSLAPETVKTFFSKTKNPPVIFMFPGQGAQYAGMGLDLYETEPLFRQEIDRCLDILEPLPGENIKEILYPGDVVSEMNEEGSFGSNRPDMPSRSYPPGIDQTRIAQPLIFTIEYALAKLLMAWGIKPYAMIGHSIGEYTAACLAGVFSLEDALTLVSARGRLVGQMPGGAMLSVPLNRDKLEPLLNEQLSMAAVNGPGNCVVSGTYENIDAFELQLKEKGFQCRRLHTSHAFHSRMMEPVLTEFADLVSRMRLNKPTLPYISDVTGNWITVQNVKDPGYWASHLRKTVRFADGINELLKIQNPIFVEMGPGKSLSTFVRQHNDNKAAQRVLNLLRHPKENIPDQFYLLNQLGQLWLYGVKIDWPGFYGDEKRRRIPLPAYPFEGQSFRVDEDLFKKKNRLPWQQSPEKQTNDLADFFYIPLWKPTVVDVIEKEDMIGKTPWLVFVDECGIGTKLVEKLKKQGYDVITVEKGTKFNKIRDRCYEINPAFVDDYYALFDEFRQRRITPQITAHLWNITGEIDDELTGEQFEKAQYQGFYSLAYMIRAMMKQELSDKFFKITVVSDHMQDVTGQENLCPAKNTLLACVNVIPQEFTNIRCSSIDIVLPRPGSWQESKLLLQLEAEIPGKSTETVIAYRNNRRWVQIFEAVKLEKDRIFSTPLRQSGVYLITGGFGSIGLILAGYLARDFGARLVLTGRSGLPKREEWHNWLSTHDNRDSTSRKILEVQEIEKIGGEVLVYSVDVANQEQMMDVITRAEKQFGPINGVIHAAGITAGPSNQCPIEKISGGAGEEQFTPKVYGLLVLEKIFKDKKLDFCMVMSSLSSILGGLGYAAYAAANLFMDAFIRKYTGSYDSGWMSVNWDGWQAEAEDNKDERILAPGEGRDAFKLILDWGQENRVIVSKTDLQTRVRQWIRPGYLQEQDSLKQENRTSLQKRPDLSTPYVKYRNPLEKVLVNIWEKFFGVEPIGIYDDFFQLGGDSLKVITVISRIHKELNKSIPLAEFFNRPFIVGLAEYLSSSERSAYYSIFPLEKREYYLQSSTQKRLYFLQQMDKDSTAYNNSSIFHLEGKVDKDGLVQALRDMIHRHESLRTSMERIREEPVQRIHKAVEFDIEYYDIDTGEENYKLQNTKCHQDQSKVFAENGGSRGGSFFEKGVAPPTHLELSDECGKNERDETKVCFLNKFLQGISNKCPPWPPEAIIKSFIRPFDLLQAPLLRVGLVKLEEAAFLLMVDMHHIISDGVSAQVLVEDFSALYAGNELQAINIHYKDYAGWQNRERISNRIREQGEYWEEVYQEEIPILELPTDYARPAVQDFAGNRINFEINSNTCTALKSLAQDTGTTLYIVLLALYSIFLAKLSSQEDIVIGTPVAGRRHADLEKIIGMFVNTLALRNDPSGEKEFLDFLNEVKEAALKGFENQEYQYEDLVEQVSVNRDVSRNPLFDTMFVLQNTGTQEIEIPGLKMAPFEYENKTSKFDLTLTVMELEDTLHSTFEYSTKLFKKATVERFITYFISIIQAVTENSRKRISHYKIITEEERKRILLDFNDTRREFPRDKTIHGLFAEQVEKTPDNTALEGKLQITKYKLQTKHKLQNTNYKQSGAGTAGAGLNFMDEGVLTYRELDNQANGLANVLIEKGVRPDTIVGIMVERSVEMIVGIMGILKSGGAYLPVDPDYPGERVNYMLSDSNAKILLTARELTDFSSSSHLHPLQPPSAPATCLAYTIYTSGTTGKPKGVVIEHHSLVNRLTWMQKTYPLDQQDTILQKTTYTFDVSVWEIFWWSITGAKVCLLPAGGEKDPRLITRTVERNHVTVMHFVPSMLSVFLDYLHETGDARKLAGLKQVIASGEALLPVHVERFYRLLKENSTALANLYGPTEATIDVSYFDCQASSKIIPIGKPIDNICLYILDKYMHLQPPGIPGELYISGIGLARGYLNRPVLTAERFIRDGSHKSYNSYMPYYRTGDLARWLSDGNLEYLGRLDQQLKIRGFRIEPGEIQGRLLKHKAIREALVVAIEDAEGDKYLTAYFVSNRELADAQLREYLLNDLPEYMIPAYLVRIEKIPLTPNGKPDCKALPAPGIKGTGVYVSPRDEIEKKLVEIWAGILTGTSPTRIGIDDNFFRLGGHSLKATTLVSMVHKVFNVILPLAGIFKRPTIRGLSDYIRKAVGEKYFSIEPVEKKEYHALSSVQKRLYFLQQIDNAGIAYNMPSTWILAGLIDINRLEQAIKKLIRRHESLRTSFIITNEEPVQRIQNQMDFEIKLLAGVNKSLSPNNQSPGFQPEAIIKSFIQPFDLSKAPLMRVGLLNVQEQEHILVVDIHHIISDGISTAILIEEFAAFYQGEKLPRLRLQYKDYAAWQNREQKGGSLMRQRDFWLKEFAGEIPVLDLPYDYDRPAVRTYSGKMLTFDILKEETLALNRMASAQGATLYMALLSITGIFLAKLSGLETVVVGTPVANRTHADLDRIIGMFVNTLAIKNEPVGEKTVREFLNQVKEKTLNAFANQDYQYEELVEHLAIDRSRARNPLFDTLFALQNFETRAISVPNLNLQPYPYERGIVKFDLCFQCFERSDTLFFTLEYPAELFKDETAARFVGYFKNILAAVLERPGGKISGIEIISARERKQLLISFNNTGVEFPGEKNLIGLFAEQVEQTPDNIVLPGAKLPITDSRQDDHISVTYRELHEYSNRLGGILRQRGIQPDHIVGIMVEPSLEMVIGMLAILKSGGAYLPLDPDHPARRRSYMLSDSGAVLLLTASRFSKKVGFVGPIISIDETDLYSQGSTGLNKIASPGNILYSIYTSGTTGKSKGVLIENRNLVNYVGWFREKARLTGHDRAILTSSFGFDLGCTAIYPSILSGGGLHMAAKEIYMSPDLLLEYICRHQITYIKITPSLFSVLVESPGFSNCDLSSLRLIVLGGEPIKLKDIEKAHVLYPGIRIMNHYGPTEATIGCVAQYIDFNDFNHYKETPTIGQPIANMKIYILDRGFNLSPLGVPGELCISGPGVGRGYINRPELTAEKFHRDNKNFLRKMAGPGGAVFSKRVPAGRRKQMFYRTGDLARWQSGGKIEFLGRWDNQVKIRGYRIELGEIENQLLTYRQVKRAVVLAVETPGDKYLCAYIVTDSETGASGIRESLSGELPDYMIPAYIVRVEKIPLTPNGKIDPEALPKPWKQAGDRYIGPRNDIEKKLVEVWAKVLGNDPEHANQLQASIGIDDNFFQLGGHSLKANLLTFRIYKALKVKLPLTVLFKTPTIRGLSEYIRETGENIYESINPVEKREYYELSSSQKRMYVLQQLDMSSIAYNMPNIIPLPEEVDIDKLKESVKNLIKRHESLRTSFQMRGDQPVQVVYGHVGIDIERYGQGMGEKNYKIQNTNNKLQIPGKEAGDHHSFIRPFDLAQAPLVRVGTLKTAAGRTFLLVDMHHIISDGVSRRILREDFTALCSGKELNPLRINYKDFAQWQNSRKEVEKLQRQMLYWKKEFAGEIPVLELPTDYPRPMLQGFAGDTLAFPIDPKAAEGLIETALAEGATPFMVISAVFAVLLAKLSGQEDFVVGIDIEGRRHADTQEIIGMFVNALALRYYPAPAKTVKEFLAEVKDRTVKSFENQDYRFDELVGQVSAARDTSRNPVFDTMLSYRDAKPGEASPVEIENPGDSLLESGSFNFEWKTSKFDLTLNAVKTGQDFGFYFEYSTELFRQDTIRRFSRYFKQILLSVTGNRDLAISQIQVISSQEKAQLLFDFNNTKTALPADKSYPRLFEEQATGTPDKIAAVHNHLNITYRTLNQTANHLAALLAGQGITANRTAAIYLKRSITMLAAIIGVFKAGGAYVPVDINYPRNRTRHILEDSGAQVIITRDDSFDWEGGNVLYLDPGQMTDSPTPGYPVSAPQVTAQPDDLAYIIYTSGSTGKPKGVMIHLLGMINHLYAKINDLRISSDEIVAQTASACFDISVWQFLSGLLTGGTTCIIDEEVVLGGKQFLRELQRNRITILETVPSLMNAFLEVAARETDKRLDRLRWMIPTGEPLTAALAREWFRHYPNIKLVNAYGPTEASDDVTHYILTGPPPPIQTTVPIGKPIQNTHIYILDRNLSLCPIGVKGEICVAGLGVGKGYREDSEKTKIAFIPNPYREETGETAYAWLYKTGDIGYYREDGNIECLGRIDYQVKIRGNRIELGEIENRILNYGPVKEAVVIDKEDKQGSKYLCAYLTVKEKFDTPGLKEYLANQLPGYMVPAFFVELAEFPLTPNGKIDRKALPDPEDISIGEETEYIPPVSALEKKLAETWEQVLGRKNIGTDENFFMVGGDSIKAIQIVSRMSSAGYKLQMRDLFQYPVISQLAPHIKKLEYIPDQAAITGTIPLTPIQEVFFNECFRHPHHYNQAVLLYSKQGFDKGAIKDIFTRIQQHHDALRMTYHRDESSGKIIQTAHDSHFPLSLREYDLRKSKKCSQELERKINRIQASIDLEKGPLTKLGLFHLNDGDRLLIVIHHLVIDGISWRILFEDIETLYTQYIQGNNLVLPPKTGSFKLWSEKLQEYANSKAFLQEKSYWQKIESLEVPSIPEDFPGEDNYVKDTGSVSFTLKKEETERLLTKVNQVFNTEINDILLTALAKGIKETFAQDRVLIALEGHGRETILEDIDIGRTVGWFTGLYPAVLEVSHTNDPGRQIKEIKENLRRIPNKGVGYGILKYLTREENKKKMHFKLKPQIGFNYMGQFDAEVNRLSSFEMAKESPGNSQGPDNNREYLIEVSGITANNRLTMTVLYNKNHFKPGTMKTLTRNFQSQLTSIIALCCARKNSEPTPGDFTYKSLSIESLDRLTAMYPDPEDLYILTPMQEGMLYHALADHTSYSYFEQISYRLQGELDIDLVEKSLNRLFKRHHVLRTAFVYKDLQRPVQLVLKNRAVDFYYEDISKIRQQKKRENFIRQFKEKDKKRSFDLSKDVLMRVTIFRMKKSAYEFIWSFHHILMDGWCTGILNAEFLEIYNSYIENRPYRLPGVKPYRTYIQWLRKQDKEESSRYWQNYLESYEEQARVPGKKAQPEENRNRNETVSAVLDREQTAGLNKLVYRDHVTLNTVTRTLWGILLGKYNGKEDVVFGAVVSGRPPGIEGVESMVGLFINTIPVRIRFEEKMKFYRLVQKVQAESLAGEPYHYYPLADIQSAADLKQNLIDHIFIFENYPIAEQIEGYGNKGNKPGLILTDVDVFEQTNYDFNVILGGTDRINLIFQFNGNVYDRDFVERMAGHFLLAVDQVIENRELEVRELTLLSKEEKHRLLYEFNNATAAYPPDKTICRLFEEQANQTPGGIALQGPSGIGIKSGPRTTYMVYFSYRQLHEKSHGLAGLLKRKGLRPDNIAGIAMDMSVELIIAILAILKAGGAYLPIDPEYPQERIDYMLKDSNARILLSAPDLTSALEPSPSTSTSTSICPVSPTSLAYIIYTSGTTGKPKGVTINHSSIFNTIYWRKQDYDMKPGHRALQLFSFAFDGFLTSFFTPVVSGAMVVQLRSAEVKDIVRIKETIVSMNITHFICVPSLYRSLLEICTGKELSGLNVVTLAGEQVHPETIEKSKRINPHLEICNEYGPTEASVAASLYRDVRPGKVISIGRPITNARIYIVDKNIDLVPIGISGEMAISGKGLARGYLNQPELTAERFILATKSQSHKDVYFSWCPGAMVTKIYRTGDLARWLPDRNIQFLGRIDHQVKIRGFRVEPGEIENSLLNHPGINEAVVLVQTEEKEDNYLCAYIVADREYETASLREFLLKGLPDYMIPSYFVHLDRIPLAETGKINRNALPKPGDKTGQSYTSPTNNMERKLVKIWSEVLGRDEVHSAQLQTSIGIHDDFFLLGGHSLKVTLAAAKIHKEFDIKVPLAKIFKIPTIKLLAEYLEGKTKDFHTTIEPAEEKEYYDLSPAQKRLYILQQLMTDNTAYNMPDVIPLGENVRKKKLESLFKKLIQRHESLRTSFITVNEKPAQKIHRQVDFSIGCFEINEEAGPDSLIPGFTRPFNLKTAPLLKVNLVTVGSARRFLFIDMHHIITDGTSQGILGKEFRAIQEEEELRPLRLRYKDYSEWYNNVLRQETLNQQESFWLNIFSEEIPVLNFPTDYPRPSIQGIEGNVVSFTLNSEETASAKRIASENHSTLYMFLLAVFNVLLSKLSGQEDIIIGTPIAARRHADLQDVIGMLVNTLAMRNYPGGDKSFADFLKEVNQQTLDNYENQEYPFEVLVDKITLNRDTSRNPVFDVMFNLLNQADYKSIVPEPEEQDTFRHIKATSKFDLNLTAVDRGERLSFTLEYSTRLFKPETIETLIRYFKNILKVLFRDTDLRISRIEIMDKQGQAAILRLSGGIADDYDNINTVHHLFAQQASGTPDNIAVTGQSLRMRNRQFPAGAKAPSPAPVLQLTYRELNETSAGLACRLKEKGVELDSVVGLMVERSVEMIIGMLAIMKAGGAYLPIDAEYPGERKQYMLEEGKIRWLLASDNPEDINNEMINQLEVIDPGQEDIYSKKNHKSEYSGIASHLAYVIYTSGSTGKPKGVMVEHGNLINLLKFQFKYTNIDCSRIMQFSTISFDASFHEIFSAFLSGGQLFPVNKETRTNIPKLFKLIEKNGIRTVFLPISFLKMIFKEEEFIKSIPKSLRHIQTAGDQVIVNDNFRRFLKEKKVYLHNHYGPSETHVVTTLTIDPAGDIARLPAIGKPVMNTGIFIVDKWVQLLPPGIPGEIFIAGVQVGRGYLNKPELTADRFRLRPGGVLSNKTPPPGPPHKNVLLNQKLLQGVQGDGFLEKSPPGRRRQKIYKTGDLARWLSDGNIEFLGRIDHQVKIRGFRIELGEIESHLLRHEAVKGAVVVCRESGDRDKYLCAYIVGQQAEFREYLLKTLPDYMIPAYFMIIDKIPLTSSGKIDKKMLPKPALEKSTDYTPPRDNIETKLVEIWADVLEVEKEKIGIDSSFFQLGGHSLKATIMVSRIHKAFGTIISLVQLFKIPFIRHLAETIKSAQKKAFKDIQSQEKKEYYQLSYNQKRLWIIQQTDPVNTAYNIVGFFLLPHHTDVETVRKTLAQMGKKHESFRTAFKEKNGQPFQFIENTAEIPLEFIEITAPGEKDREMHREAIIEKEKRIPFDLTRAPLFRVKLVKQEDRWYFIFNMHHIISDGWSNEILKRDFLRWYEIYRTGQEEPTEIPALQYKDFAAWQNYCIADPGLKEKALQYWLNTLGNGIEPFHLPGDFERTKRNSATTNYQVPVSNEVKDRLKEIAAGNNTTLFILMFSVFNWLLARFSGCTEILCGIISAGREYPGLQDIVGYFVNSLPARIQVKPDEEFDDFLHRVDVEILELYQCQSYPLELVVDELEIPYPEVSVCFNMLNMQETPADLELENLRPGHIKDTSEAKFDLVLFAAEYKNALVLNWSYRDALYKPQTIEIIARGYQELLKAVTSAGEEDSADQEE